MHVPLVDLKRQHKLYKKTIEDKILAIMRNGDYVLGSDVTEFEKEFADFTGAKYAIGVASGTDALLLSLKALGIGPGDEVITVSHTFIATALGITYAGATPVFVDIDEKTYNLNPDLVESKITKRTKAILPVCLYGQPPDLTKLQKIAQKHHLKLIIDACQAHGSRVTDKALGTFGDAVVYSFYPTKNLGAYGDGGAITTNSKAVYDAIIVLRNVGRNGWYEHPVKGYNSRLDTIQAAVLRTKLPDVHSLNSKRREKAATYTKLLSALPITLPYEDPEVYGVYYLYVIRTKKREDLMKFLKNKGIHTAVHYPKPIHLQPAYKELGYKKGDLPISEKVAREVVSLPFFPQITLKEQQAVRDALKKYFRSV